MHDMNDIIIAETQLPLPDFSNATYDEENNVYNGLEIDVQTTQFLAEVNSEYWRLASTSEMAVVFTLLDEFGNPLDVIEGSYTANHSGVGTFVFHYKYDYVTTTPIRFEYTYDPHNVHKIKCSKFNAGYVRGVKQINGVKEGFTEEGLDDGYIYFIRTSSDAQHGYIFLNGKKYGDAPMHMDCGTY